MSRWAVFLDRDGTLNAELGLITKPEEIKLLPGAAEAVKKLHAAGAFLVLVTNQPVVARGLVDEIGLKMIHLRLAELLKAQGAQLDAYYYCPHHPEKHHPGAQDPLYRRECDCRKPKAGMVLDAAKKNDLDVAHSFLVGDSTRDVLTAKTAGCTSVLVMTGNGGKDGKYDVRPDMVCDDVLAAADWIVGQVKAAK